MPSSPRSRSRPIRTLHAALVLLASAAFGHAQLDLPDRDRRSGSRAGAARGGERAAPSRAGEPVDATASVVGSVLAGLAGCSDPDDPRLPAWVEHWRAAGPAGLVKARGRLGSSHAPMLLAAARVLLASGEPDDLERVRVRLRQPLPAGVLDPLLVELERRDPGRTGPAFLVPLLDHPSAGVRQAMAQRLEGRLDAAHLTLLAEPLESARSSTRLAALDLVAGVADPEALALLVASLDDRTAKVAARTADLLAASPLPGVGERLRALVFDTPVLDRRGAYALLALLRREEERRAVLLTDADVPHLLEGLADPRPLIRGAVAVALASVGYRSEQPGPLRWLDRDVPHVLVRIAVGDVFHGDYTTLRRPGIAALQRLSGESFASSGPEWKAWWVAHAEGFRARRAVLPLSPGDERTLRVHLTLAGGEPAPERLPEPGSREPGASDPEWDGGRELLLLGPAWRPPSRPRPPSEVARTEAPGPVADGGEPPAVTPLSLDADRAATLLGRLEAEGVFSGARLSGWQGGEPPALLTLRVDVTAGTKVFRLGRNADAPWAERLHQAIARVADEERWQRCIPSPWRGGDAAAWERERSWWSEGHPEPERARRLAELVFDAFGDAGPTARRAAVRELRRTLVEGGRGTPEDYERVLAWLAQERRFGPVALATPAGGASPLEGPGPPASERTATGNGSRGNERTTAPETLAEELLELLVGLARTGMSAPDGTLAVRHARTLLELLAQRFGDPAERGLGLVLAESPEAFVLEASADVRPLVRRAAATRLGELAREGSVAAGERLVDLLADSDTEVCARAIDSIGSIGSIGDASSGAGHPPAGRAELLELARGDAVRGTPALRRRALAALARLAARTEAEESDVRELAILAVADVDPKTRLAGIEALAELRDPECVSVLASVFARGPGEPSFAVARRGLVRLGRAAEDVLLRQLTSARRGTRREAALVLARTGAPEAASPLLTLLSQDARDARVAEELAVLTAYDARPEPDPVRAWWSWWDTVVHTDALAWLRGGCERHGWEAPPAEALEGAGTRVGAEFLVSLALEGPPHLSERARRELERLLDRELSAPGDDPEEREAWIDGVRAAIEGRFGGF